MPAPEYRLPAARFSFVRTAELIRDRAEPWACSLDRRPALVIAFLGVVYAVLIQARAWRPLWFDELFTYYVANLPGPLRLLNPVPVDVNLPLITALTRLSLRLFGDSPFAARLPSMAAFFFASAAILIFLSRRAGVLWAAACVLLFWHTPLFNYATEDRPYALVLAFFSLTLVSWDCAAQFRPRRKLALLGIVCGNAGLIFSHGLAPLSILPFYLAELVRWRRRPKADWPLWVCLSLPLPLMALYIPLRARLAVILIPPSFQASLKKIAWFYVYAVHQPIAAAFLAGVLVALFVSAASRGIPRRPTAFRMEDTGLLAGLLALPLLINLLLMRTHSGFWDRYCITTAAAMCIAAVLCVAWRTGFHGLPAAALAATLLGIMVGQTAWPLFRAHRFSAAAPDASGKIEWIRPDLPFVDAGALTFLSMDHNENAGFLSRVYYLTDHDSAVRYAHATLFETLAGLDKYFPIRAHVASYRDFVDRHRRFLVLGTIDYPEDWLLRKLLAEGAELRYLGTFELPYDDTTLYEVTIPDAMARP